jgi:cytochrome c-type biogenesis protein CcmH/NrfG
MAAKSTQRFRRLQKASNRHQCHLAVAIGKRYCRRFPEHAPAWLFFGRALAEAARYDEARVALENALNFAPVDRMAAIATATKK